MKAILISSVIVIITFIQNNKNIVVQGNLYFYLSIVRIFCMAYLEDNK